MNNSIQKEIAAPQDCKKNLWLISIVLVNLLILAAAFTVLILKTNKTFDNKYITVPLFISIIVVIAIATAFLLRKHHVLMLITLTSAAVDCAALMMYHSAYDASGSHMVWRIVTIALSFAVLIFALLFVGIYYSKPRERNVAALSVTKYLTYCAMFTALAVICKMIGNAVSNAIPIAGANLKLTVVYIPWVFGGIVLGPIGGFAAAAIGDLIGQLAVSTGGMPFPGLILSNGLFAVFPAVVYKLVKMKNTNHRAWIAVLFGTFLSTIFCTLGISTYTLYNSIYTGHDTFFAYLAIRLIQTVIIAINIALMATLVPSLVKAKIVRQPVTQFFD